MQGRNKQMQTVKKVLASIRQYRLLVLLSLLFAAVTVFSTLYFPILTGNAIDLILKKGQVDFGGILEIIKKAGILVAVTAAAQWLMNVINNRITFQVIRDIREEAFRKIEVLPLKYLDAHSTGEIVSRIIADADQFADGLLMGFTQLYAFDKYPHYGSCSRCHAGIAVCGCFYCKEHLPDVPEAVAEQGRADRAY